MVSSVSAAPWAAIRAMRGNSFSHNSTPQFQGLKPTLCPQPDRASFRLSSHPPLHWTLSTDIAWRKHGYVETECSVWSNMLGPKDVLLWKTIGSPVTVIWPSPALASAVCKTTSGLISTDAPLSSTPACSEEGTRTHTAPTYDRKIRGQHKRKWNLQKSFSLSITLFSVNFCTGSISYVDVDASTVRRNIQETIRTICQSKDSLRMLMSDSDRYHTWLIVQSELAFSPIIVSPDMFFTVASPLKNSSGSEDKLHILLVKTKKPLQCNSASLQLTR